MASQDHPWIHEFEPVPNLSSTLRVWTFLAGHIAAGKLGAVARDWSSLDTAEQRGGLEVALQTHIFAGYPRAFAALAAIREVGLNVEGASEEPASPWAERGEGLCREAWGDEYPQVRRRMASLHPALDRWTVEFAFGRVLSRPGLTFRERELCAVAAIAGLGTPGPLLNHLRGALLSGATQEECAAIVWQTQHVFGPTEHARAEETWRRFRGDLAPPDPNASSC